MNNPYKLPILTYHSIIKDASEAGQHNIYVKQNVLRKQLQYVKKHNYETITFRDIKDGKVTDFTNKVILTFDDGYEDNYTLLFPLLKEFNYKAVIFLVTQLNYNKWGVDEGEPNRKLLNQDEIIEMDRYGIEFGGHSRLHPDLHKVSTEQKMDEIKGSKLDIENLLQKTVISFAYPFGAISEEIKQITKDAGYTFGIATKSGPIDFHDDLFQIRRIEIASRTPHWVFKLKVSGYYLTRKYILF